MHQREKALRKILIATSLILAAHAHAIEKKDIDILSLKTGMSLAEVENTIKAKFPNAVIYSQAKFKSEFGLPESIGKIGYCFGEATKPGAKEMHGGIPVYFGCSTKLVELSFTRIGAKVFKIERKEDYDSSRGKQKVSWDSAMQAAKQKYGEPTVKTGETILTWQPQQAGSPQATNCSLQNFERNKPDYRAYLPGCGFHLTFSSNKLLSNPGLASNLSMALIDYEVVNEDFAKLETLAKGHQQQRQSDELKGAAAPKM